MAILLSSEVSSVRSSSWHVYFYIQMMMADSYQSEKRRLPLDPVTTVVGDEEGLVRNDSPTVIAQDPLLSCAVSIYGSLVLSEYSEVDL